MAFLLTQYVFMSSYYLKEWASLVPRRWGGTKGWHVLPSVVSDITMYKAQLQEPVNTYNDVHKPHQWAFYLTRETSTKSQPKPWFKYLIRSINEKTKTHTHFYFTGTRRTISLETPKGHYEGGGLRPGPVVDCDFMFKNKSNYSQMPIIFTDYFEGARHQLKWFS